MAKVSFLLICDSYPPQLGGSEVEAQRICSAMIRQGHEALVLCSGGPPMPPLRDWIDPAGVPVRILTRNSRGRLKDIAFALEVAWAIWNERDQYQIVYFLMQGLHLAAGLPVARLLGKPIVMKFGGSGVIPLMRGSRVGRWELDWLRQWASRLLVLNQGMIDEAIADGFDRSQLFWMPNPTDTDEFRPAQEQERMDLRRRFELPATAPVAIYVGRLSHEKGLVWLLEAFAQVAKAVPDALLVLLGDGALRGELTELAARLGLGPERLRFAGRVDVSDVSLWLRACDIFTLTSPSEGFSCALAEAMSSGLPSVVSDIPANRQLVEAGCEGLTVPAGDVGAIARALTALLSDAGLRGRMGAEARRKICENYSSAQVVALYETLFDEVLAAQPRRNPASSSE